MDNEEKREGDRGRMAEGIDIIIDEAKTATTRAYKKSGAESFGDNIRETLRGALSSRDNVVMMRLNKESVTRLDDLVEAGIVNSRSEAAAFLIGEGIAARAHLFERIAEKTETIRKAKEELQSLIEGDPDETRASQDGEDRR